MEKKCSICLSDTSGGSRGSARGARPPLFLYKTEARRAEKSFFGDRAPSLSKGLDDRLPRPPSYVKVWNHHWTQLCGSNNGCLVNVKENKRWYSVMYFTVKGNVTLKIRMPVLFVETRNSLAHAPSSRYPKSRFFDIFFPRFVHKSTLFVSHKFICIPVQFANIVARLTG